MLFFWYCFDDHLAAYLNQPALGHVPWWFILICHFPIMILTGIFSGRRTA